MKAKNILKALSVVFALALVVTGFAFFKAPAETASAAAFSTEAPEVKTADFSDRYTIDVYACSDYHAATGLDRNLNAEYGSATNPFASAADLYKCFAGTMSWNDGEVEGYAGFLPDTYYNRTGTNKNGDSGLITRVVVHVIGDLANTGVQGDIPDELAGSIVSSLSTSVMPADNTANTNATFWSYGAYTAGSAAAFATNTGRKTQSDTLTNNLLFEFVGQKIGGTDEDPVYPTIYTISNNTYGLWITDDMTFQKLNLKPANANAPLCNYAIGTNEPSSRIIAGLISYANILVIKDHVHVYSDNAATEEKANIWTTPFTDNRQIYRQSNGNALAAANNVATGTTAPTTAITMNRFQYRFPKTLEIHSGSYGIIHAFGYGKYTGGVTHSVVTENMSAKSFRLGDTHFETTAVDGKGPTFKILFGTGTRITGTASGDGLVALMDGYTSAYYKDKNTGHLYKAANTAVRYLDVQIDIALGATGYIGRNDTEAGARASGIFGGFNCNVNSNLTVGTETIYRSNHWEGDLTVNLYNGTVSAIAGNRSYRDSSASNANDHVFNTHKGDVTVNICGGTVERFVTPNYGGMGVADGSSFNVNVYGGRIGYESADQPYPTTYGNSKLVYRGLVACCGMFRSNGSGSTYTYYSNVETAPQVLTNVNIYGGTIFAVAAMTSSKSINNMYYTARDITINIEPKAEYDAPSIALLSAVGAIDTANSFGHVSSGSTSQNYFGSNCILGNAAINVKDGAGKDGKTAKITNIYGIANYLRSTKVDKIDFVLGTEGSTENKPEIDGFVAQGKYAATKTSTTNFTVTFNGLEMSGDIKGNCNFNYDPNTTEDYTGATLGVREWNTDTESYDLTDGLTFVFNGGTYSGAITGTSYSADLTALNPDEKLKVFKIEINDGTFSGVISASGNEATVGYAEIEINGGTFTESAKVTAINFSTGGDGTNKEAVVEEYYLNIPATSTATFENPEWNLTSTASSSEVFERTKPTVNDCAIRILGGTFAPNTKLSVDTTATSDPDKFTVTISGVAPVIYTETETGLTHTLTRNASTVANTEATTETYTFDLKTWVLGSPRTDARTIYFDSALGVRYLFNKQVFDAASLSNINIAVTIDGTTTNYSVSDLGTSKTGYYDLFIAGIAPKDIDKVVTLVVTANWNSKELTDTFEDSVKAALDQVVNDEDGAFSANFHNAAQAVLEYAQAAADQFLGEGVKEYWTGEEITDVQPGAEIATYSEGTGDITLLGTSLVLKDEVAIKFWADASAFSGTIDSVTVKINGNAAEVVKEINGGTKHYWTFKVSVPISQMNSVLGVQIFQNDSAVSNTYYDSVYNYAVCSVTPAYNMSDDAVATGHAILNYISYVNTYLTEQ